MNKVRPEKTSLNFKFHFNTPVHLVDPDIMTHGSVSGLCCCSPCRPTFRRHVDAIFPSDANEGLVKNKMETLVYYAVTSPEKLDRIGEYLEQRISRDIYRNRKGLVFIGMEAMDQLIKSCRINTINLFVESFLKTVQKLLESPDPELEV